MVANLFFSLQIFIDRLFLSKYSPDAAGAALTGAMLMSVPMMLIQNTAGFATTFVAQYYGAKQFSRIGPVVWQAIYIAAVCGTLVVGVIPFANHIVSWFGHAEHLQPLETNYFQMLILCVLPLSLVSAMIAFQSGRGRTLPVIVINAVGCVVNGLLDYLLIFGHLGFPKWGIFGAGLATVAGCWASAVLAWLLFRNPKEDAVYHNSRGWRLDVTLLKRLVYFGFPNGLQACAELIAWSVFTLFVGWLGAVELAATSIIFTINAIFYIPMVGLGQAAGVYVGQNLGANRPGQAEYGMKIGIGVTLVFMTTMGLLVALLPKVALWLFATQEPNTNWEDVANLLPLLLWFVAIYSPFDGLNTLLAFGLRGAGDTRFISFAYLIVGILFIVLPSWWIGQNHAKVDLSWLLPYWQLNKTEAAFYLSWIMATLYVVTLTVLFIPRFLYGPWRGMRVIEPRLV